MSRVGAASHALAARLLAAQVKEGAQAPVELVQDGGLQALRLRLTAGSGAGWHGCEGCGVACRQRRPNAHTYLARPGDTSAASAPPSLLPAACTPTSSEGTSSPSTAESIEDIKPLCCTLPSILAASQKGSGDRRRGSLQGQAERCLCSGTPAAASSVAAAKCRQRRRGVPHLPGRCMSHRCLSAAASCAAHAS